MKFIMKISFSLVVVFVFIILLPHSLFSQPVGTVFQYTGVNVKVYPKNDAPYIAEHLSYGRDSSTTVKFSHSGKDEKYAHWEKESISFNDLKIIKFIGGPYKEERDSFYGTCVYTYMDIELILIDGLKITANHINLNVFFGYKNGGYWTLEDKAEAKYISKYDIEVVDWSSIDKIEFFNQSGPVSSEWKKEYQERRRKVADTKRAMAEMKKRAEEQRLLAESPEEKKRIENERQLLEKKQQFTGKKVKIINKGRIYTGIHKSNCIVWPNDDIKKKGGRKYWGWSYSPANGDIGTIIWEAVHCRSKETIYIIKTGNYYVPINSNAVTYIE